MRTFRCALLGSVVFFAGFAYAQPGRYPTVIGPSGVPYGPTQAEYQYRQRYGQPSPEFRAGGLGMNYVNGYPGTGGGGGGGYHNYYPPFVNVFPSYGYGYGYPTGNYTFYPSSAYYGVAYPYGAFAPQPFLGPVTPGLLQEQPRIVPGFNNGMMNPALSNAELLNALGQQPIDPLAAMNQPDTVIQPSPLTAQQESVRLQVEGDQLMHQLSFPAATDRYRKSIQAAKERVEPRIRLAIASVARGRYLDAVEQLQLSVAIDPTWPQHYESLDDLIGPRNTLEKNRIKTRVAEWTLQDPRDPNRLFLLGVLMYLDGEAKAGEILNTAQLLSGGGDHVAAFLNAPQPLVAPPKSAPPAPGLDVEKDLQPHHNPQPMLPDLPPPENAALPDQLVPPPPM